MRIESTQHPGYLLVSLVGRLDATWSEHFLDVIQSSIRDGHHQIRVDASALEYLSSAGIRSILRVHQELRSVDGRFGILRASDFVAETLRMSGFGELLVTEEEETEPQGSVEKSSSTQKADGFLFEVYPLTAGATLEASRPGRWKPWDPVKPEDPDQVIFSENRFAFGIGAPGRTFEEVRGRFGEFSGAAGCVAWLPGDEGGAPDYLVQSEQFFPGIHAIESWLFSGEFSHLLRFGPEEAGGALGLSGLCRQVLDITGAAAAGFVAVAEVDGLVGVSLTRSPGLIGPDDRPGEFPQIRDWVAFCGERVHHDEQVVMTGVAVRRSSGEGGPTPAGLLPLPSAPGVLGHAHVAVFPFQPLPQGLIGMADSVRRVFDGGEPAAVLHLIEDDRPGVGLGESTFEHGALWCAPIRNFEEPQA